MKKAFFLGQAPAKPNSKHEIPGTYLHAWLRRIGLEDRDIDNYCSFYALVDMFPGSAKNGHVVPQAAQMQVHRPFLIKALQLVQPDIIVPVGKLAIAEILNQKQISLNEVVGSKIQIDPFNALGRTVSCIPFSHPSGRSTWNVLHPEKVETMLALLKHEVTRN